MRSPTVEIFVDSKCAQHSFSLLNTQRIESDFLNILIDLMRVQSRRFCLSKNIIKHQSPKVKVLLGPNLKQWSGKSLGNMRRMSARKPVS